MKITNFTSFNLQSGQEYTVEMTMFNVQGIITPKVSQSDLRFMCSACRLIILHICVKFRENITKGIRVMERTREHGRNGYVQCSRGDNSVSRQTRVMIHFCTSCHGGLHWCEVSWKYLKRFQSYGADMKLWSADGRADTQNFGRYNIIPRHLYCGA